VGVIRIDRSARDSAASSVDGGIAPATEELGVLVATTADAGAPALSIS
jgi:hypothetical protein